MKIAAEMEWRNDCWGKPHKALYLGSLCVGHIMEGSANFKSGQWRGWFMNDEDGDETGWFRTAEEARASVERALFDALQIQKEIA